MSEHFCNKCGYVGPESVHYRPGTSNQCHYLAAPPFIKQPDTIQIPISEYEKLKADAERYAEARKGKALVVECTNRHGKYVIYHIGDRDEAVDFPERYDEAIDAAIKQEGGA